MVVRPPVAGHAEAVALNQFQHPRARAVVGCRVSSFLPFGFLQRLAGVKATLGVARIAAEPVTSDIRNK